MEESKLPGGGTNVGGGWLSRQLKRVSGWIKDSPFLSFFFGGYTGLLDFAANGAESMGLKTSYSPVELTLLEQQQLDAWADQFLLQFAPQLENFARYDNNNDLQQKIDLLNKVNQQASAIKAHYAAATAGMTANQVSARNAYIKELMNGLVMKVDFLTTDLPVQVSLKNTTFPMNKIDTNGITANSPVTTVVVPQITTQVKGSGITAWIAQNGTTIPFNPEPSSPVKDVATVDPVKVDPNAPATTPTTNTSTNSTSNTGKKVLSILALVGLAFGVYSASKGGKKKSKKK